MRKKLPKILKIAGIVLVVLAVIWVALPLRYRLDILIAAYPPMREQSTGITCGLGYQRQVTAVDWVMKGSSFEEVFDCIEHWNYFVRKAVFIKLNCCNRKAATPHLLDLAQNGTSEQKINSLFWLRVYGPDAIDVIAELEQMLDEDDPTIRRHVVLAVCEINRHSEAVIPVLMEMIDSEDYRDRSTVPYCLYKVNLPADEIIPICIHLLEDEDDCVRDNAAFTLGYYGSLSEEAIPALENALERTEDPWKHERISEAIEKIQNPQD